jgi:hypothetical protein
MGHFARLQKNLHMRQPVELIFHAGDTAISEKSGKPYPKARETWRADGHYAARYNNIIKTPRDTINIWFPTTNLRRIAQIFKEFRNDAGVVLGSITTDWTQWEEETLSPEIYEIYNPQTQRRAEVSEAEFDTYLNRYKVTGRETLRLFFMVQELMDAEIFCVAQMETRGMESSIPSILNTIRFFAAAGKLQVGFKLVLAKQEGKGMDSTGKTVKTCYPTITLVADTSEAAQTAIAATVQRFLSLAVSPALQRPPQFEKQPNYPALNAAPPDIDSSTAEPDNVPVITDTVALPETLGLSMLKSAPTPNDRPAAEKFTVAQFTLPQLKRLAEQAGCFADFVQIQHDPAQCQTLWQRLTAPVSGSQPAAPSEPALLLNAHAAELAEIQNKGTPDQWQDAVSALQDERLELLQVITQEVRESASKS